MSKLLSVAKLLSLFANIVKCLTPSVWFWLALVLSLILAASFSLISSFLGDFSGEFYNVTTENPSKEGTMKVLLKIALGYILLTFVQSTIKFLTVALSIHVRRLLGNYIYEKYFDGLKFLFLIQKKDEFTTIDQQLTQDLDLFSKLFSEVCTGFMATPTSLIFFWFTVSKTIGWWAPFLVVLYYILSYIIQHLLILTIGDKVNTQEKLEGIFRLIHSRVVQNFESVAFTNGQQTDKKISQNHFDKLLENKTSIILWDYALYFVTYLSAYIGVVFGNLVVVLPYLISSTFKLTPMFVATAGYNIGMLIWGFSQLTLLSNSFASLVGFSIRIGNVISQLEKNDCCNEENIELRDNEIGLVNVRINTPEGINLYQNFSFQLTSNTLLFGPSGSGKTSILRVLAGIWSFTNSQSVSPKYRYKRDQKGDRFKPKNYTEDDSLVDFSDLNGCSILFIPQKVYLPYGDIKQQIAYPLNESECLDLTPTLIESILKSVGLESLLPIEKHENERIWSFLSGGQVKKIGMARVIYHKPKIAILDEITSEVDLQCEENFYGLCQELNISYLSVGHRTSLQKFHTQMIDVSGISQGKEELT